MQQVVIKGRTYLHAYFVAKEYGYAPAHIRELYDQHHVLGVFWKGTLYLDAESWHMYQTRHATKPANAATSVNAVSLGEHRYMHHASERRSRYERDEHELRPQPQKPSTTATASASTRAHTRAVEAAVPVPAATTDRSAKPHVKRLHVALADAESVEVETVGAVDTHYRPAERPPISYTGELIVEEIYADDAVETIAEAVQQPVSISKPESEIVPKTIATPAVDTEAEAETEVDTSADHDREKPKRPSLVTMIRGLWQPKAQRVVLVMSMLLIVVGLASVLFLEQHMVVSHETTETSWRLSWQSALALWSR